jgi:hypothetical protein
MLGNVMKAFPEDGFWIFSQFVMYYCKDHLDGAQVKDLLPPREFWQQATGVPLSSEQLESHFYFPSESSVEEHRRRLTKDYLSDSCYFGMLGSVLGKGYADPSGTMWIVLIESLCQIDTEHAMLILELTYASYREDKVEFSAILREINDRYYRDMGFIVCCEWIQDKQGRWFPMVFPLKIVETKQRGLSLDWSSEQEVTVYHVKMFTDRTEGGPTSVGEYLDGLEYLGYLQEGFSVASHAHSEQYWQRVEAYPETTTGPIIVVDNENNSAFSWRATIQRAHASTDTNNLFLGLIRKMYDGRVPTQQQVYQDLIWDTENHELRHLQDAHERIGANEYLSTYTELAESQEPWLTFCNNIVGVVKYNGQRMQLALYRDSQGQLVPSGSGENHGQAQMSFLNEVAWRHGVLPEGQDFSDLGVKNPVLFDQKIREVFSILQNNYDADDLRDLAKDLLEETIPE